MENNILKHFFPFIIYLVIFNIITQLYFILCYCYKVVYSTIPLSIYLLTLLYANSNSTAVKQIFVICNCASVITG